ncbi:uncharacterized protein LTR77_002425 [Saxophila tyrrhenica]|uniref:Uncharacterized protein n=1 Tax=Saxophila tyrrhenica TaxID=1690608 RepID=A0AAV9PIK2_9PEZI|nr:hypothetical protein LTR77_002425 [Saxophila tyrrhenica]
MAEHTNAANSASAETSVADSKPKPWNHPMQQRQRYLNDASNAAQTPGSTEFLYLSPKQEEMVCNYISKFDKGYAKFVTRIETVPLAPEGVDMSKVMLRLLHDGPVIAHDTPFNGLYHLETYLDGVRVHIEAPTETPTLEQSGWPIGRSPAYSRVRHVESCVLVYDITSRESFETMRSIYDNFLFERSITRRQLLSPGYCYHDCPPRPAFRGLFFVFATKIDVDEASWAVSRKEGVGFCSQIGAVFMPMSTDTREGMGPKAVLAIAYRTLFRRIENGALQEALCFLAEQTTCKLCSTRINYHSIASANIMLLLGGLEGDDFNSANLQSLLCHMNLSLLSLLTFHDHGGFEPRHWYSMTRRPKRQRLTREEYLNHARKAARSSSPRVNALYLSPEQEAAVSKYVKTFDPAPSMFHPVIEIWLICEAGTGLEKLIVRLGNDGWLEGYDPTMEDCFSLTTDIDGQRIRLTGTKTPTSLPQPDISDEWFHFQYGWARHIEAVALVYDVTSRASFEVMCENYRNTCRERAQERNRCQWCPHECPPRPAFRGMVFIIANKIDKDPREWDVPLQDGEKFCATIDAIFMPTSAKTGEGSGWMAVLAMTYRILYRRIENGAFLESRMAALGIPPEPEGKECTEERTPQWWSRLLGGRKASASHTVQPEKKPAQDDEKVSKAPTNRQELGDANGLYAY